MTYTITREDAAEDARVLRAAITVARNFIEPSHAMVRLASLAAAIEEQVKPAIEEPQEFGSIVRAGRGGSDRVLWQHSRTSHYWLSETGIEDVWPELTDVEVLRVGLGDDRPLQVVAEDAQLKGFAAGRYNAVASIHYRLQTLLAEAITSERKNAYEKAIQAVEELAP